MNWFSFIGHVYARAAGWVCYWSPLCTCCRLSLLLVTCLHVLQVESVIGHLSARAAGWVCYFSPVCTCCRLSLLLVTCLHVLQVESVHLSARAAGWVCSCWCWPWGGKTASRCRPRTSGSWNSPGTQLQITIISSKVFELKLLIVN